jgi:hypothetical protein
MLSITSTSCAEDWGPTDAPADNGRGGCGGSDCGGVYRVDRGRRDDSLTPPVHALADGRGTGLLGKFELKLRRNGLNVQVYFFAEITG